MIEFAQKKLRRARASLVLDHPFFGSLCLRMEPTPDHTCRTAWTDGATMGFNPVYVAGLSEAGIRGLMAHTVLHAACGHHVRRKGRDPRLWNMACDHAVNWILLDAGLDLPPGYLDNPKYRGRTAEAIYTELAGLQAGEGMLDDSAAGTGPEKGELDMEDVAGAAGENRGKDEDGDESDGEGGTGDEGADVAADGAGDEQDDGGEPEQSSADADPGGSGEVRDADDESGGGSPEGETASEEQWRAALAQALHQARNSGDLPGGLERWAEGVLNPKLDWRELLDRFIQARARSDYAWTPPNKRYLHMNMILPSLSQEELPEIILAVDTSGSVAPEELEQFAAEVREILEQYDTTLRVVFCDREISGESVFRRDDPPLRLEVSGGGGTDFRPVFTHVEAQGCDPACLVYLTDMETRAFPEEEPAYPVLWARIGGAGRIPPFGDVIDIE